MKSNNARQSGVTLLEVLLVLAIAASILVMGVRQYETYRLQTNAQLIVANADKIFQAAAHYYQVECRPNRLPSSEYSDDNALAPTVTDSEVAINIKSQLIDKGYLKENLALNPLVDSSGGNSYTGYRVQFVRATEPRYVCTKTNEDAETTNPYSDKCLEKKKIGTIVNWWIQVSAKIRNAKLATAIQNMTAADCATSASGDDGVMVCSADTQAYVANCSAAQEALDDEEATEEDKEAAQQEYDSNGCGSSGEGGYGNFVSYQRLPTFSTPIDAQSGLGLTNKTLQQFKQMYDTANINYLLNVSHDPEYQYFTCGS